METQQVIPIINFGKKHNGKTITEVMAEDPGYIPWCMNQPGLKERVTIIVNQYTSQSNTIYETPQHNKLQNKFLDKIIQQKLVHISLPKTIKSIKDKQLEYCENLDIKEQWGEIKLDFEIKSKIRFEWKYNWDIYLEAIIKYDSISKYIDKKEYHRVDNSLVKHLLGEIKPCLGDDYPRVLGNLNKQIELTESYFNSIDNDSYSKYEHKDRKKDYCIYLLIIEKFESESASKKELIQVFNNSKIRIIFMEDLINYNIDESETKSEKNKISYDDLVSENAILLKRLKAAEDKIKELEEKELKILKKVKDEVIVDEKKNNNALDIRAFFGGKK